MLQNTGTWCVPLFWVMLIDLKMVSCVHTESCHRSPSTTSLYAKSRNQTQWSQYTVYPDGIQWTTQHSGDTMRLTFRSVRIGPYPQAIDAYDGTDKNANLLLRLDHDGRMDIFASSTGPNAFIDYNAEGIDLMFSVACTSMEHNTDELSLKQKVLIGMGVFSIPCFVMPILVTSYIRKQKRQRSENAGMTDRRNSRHVATASNNPAAAAAAPPLAHLSPPPPYSWSSSSVPTNNRPYENHKECSVAVECTSYSNSVLMISDPPPPYPGLPGKT